jgi:DNA primase
MSKGRINPEDIVAVREKANIEDIVGERVTLRRAGANLSGLCPFHDDSSPSFTVNPSRNLFHCFGCGEGGDVISFVQKTENLTFVEAVERLAEKTGIELRYLDGDPNYVAPPPGQRARLMAANAAANAFFRNKMDTDPDAALGKTYLTERNFGPQTWAQFSIGWAPNSHDALMNHLKGLGFTIDEIVTSGLAVKNDDNGRTYDRFRGRLLWAIKDISGDIIGFGARKLREDDQGPKWLNTPDTPLYRKSEVLYGIDTARKDIASTKQVVVVEGYGDVMAAHLAGVTTAVATCGTAFGEGHIKIVRRLLRDDDAYTGKVIFTFDGDAAGQKAALRAFKENHRFTAQTYVAVAPDNMDPCDLRLHQGDEAVRDLVAGAVPLVEFVIKSTLAGYDLGATEGRVNALRATAPIVADIRDLPMRTEYTRLLSGWLTLPDHSVRSAVQVAVKQSSSSEPATDDAPATPSWRPNPNDPALSGEREVAKALLQAASEFGDWYDVVDAEAFTHSGYRGIYLLAKKVRGEDSNAETLLQRILDRSADDANVSGFVNELSVEPLKHAGPDLHSYVDNVVMRHLDKHLDREIAVLQGQLASAPAEAQTDLLTRIMSAQTRRRALRRK